ncbi:MAG: hypothetical protein AABY78_10500 [Nitrospirota bacterium]|jgi:flagellar biosynthetic protein FliP
MTAFKRHLIEMVLSMLIPMTLLAVTFQAMLPWLGVNLSPGISSPARIMMIVVAILVMTIPMIVLMRVRGHSWQHVWEMTGAMFAPLVIIMPIVRVVLPRANITLTPALMLPIGFVAMTGGMIVLMYLRKDVYSKHTHKHHG